MNTTKASKKLQGKATQILVPRRIKLNCERIVKELRDDGIGQIYSKMSVDLKIEVGVINRFFQPTGIATQANIDLIYDWCIKNDPSK